MIEGGFGDRTDVGLVGKGGVQDDTQVADLWGRADGTAVNVQGEISNLPEQGLGCHNHELSFIAV